MSVTLLLPWFPILLGVGVGGRLLSRTHGYALGLLCALFWIVLVQASAGSGIWGDPWTVATILAGAVAIVAMGGWAGETSIAPSPGSDGKTASEEAGGEPRASDLALDLSHGRGPQAWDRLSSRSKRQAGKPVPHPGRAESAQAVGFDALERLTSALDQFDDWLEDHRKDRNPWPKFDEFLRLILYQCCRATHVRPYRLAGGGEELLPLRDPDPFAGVLGDGPTRPFSARRGILGHVVTTGRTYYAGDPTQGELIAKLAEESPPTDMSAQPIVWCFAIKEGTRRVGVVAARHLDTPPERNQALLRAVERLAARFWCTLREVCRSRAAAGDDPVSGLYTREAFLRSAGCSLDESYAQGEPVAVAVIALERLRTLNDSGRWEVADELVREVSNTLRRKVRLDDRLGRFDGSRLLLLLRRVDSELATLIIAQVMSRLAVLCEDQTRWQASITVRCGVVGSGAKQPDLRSLVSRALQACHRARVDGVPIVSDLPTEQARRDQEGSGAHREATAPAIGSSGEAVL